MAPELLAGKTFSKAVDVYAFAVLLWELFAEQMPFDGYYCRLYCQTPLMPSQALAHGRHLSKRGGGINVVGAVC